MPKSIQFLASFLRDLLRSRLSLQIEIVALRHLLAVCPRTAKRAMIQPADRILWAWLSRHWSRWREVLVFVRPETVIAWSRRRFREHRTKLSRCRRSGRPSVPQEVRHLITRMSGGNPLWGTPRIVGERGKLGIEVARSTVATYMVRHRKPPSPTRRALLKNHVREIIAADFFAVPTVRNQVLFVFLLLAHDRRRVTRFKSCDVTTCAPPTPTKRPAGVRSRTFAGMRPGKAGQEERRPRTFWNPT
jgi:putative transposase